MQQEQAKTNINGRHFDNNFAWSLKPLTWLMVLFGIRLDCLTHIRQFSKFTIQFFGLLLMLINLIDTVMQLSFYADFFQKKITDEVRMFKRLFRTSAGDSFARKVTVEMFTKIVHRLVVFALPAMFINHLYRTGKWRKLWLTLYKTMDELDLSSGFYRKCRNHCYFAIVLLLMVN